ncbi:MAG: matrixin family metalloprotease [Armatimonadota bacterium]
MSIARLSPYHHVYWLVIFVFAAVLAGCGGGSDPVNFTAPPAPQQGQTALDLFFVNTSNYFNEYTSTTAPFDSGSQFASGHYPIPVSYDPKVTEPAGFSLQTDSELAFETWAQADPRVAIISGVAVGQERIRVMLVDSITYGSANNILGLTKLISGGSNPHMEVYLARLDPITHEQMSNSELDKILTHELGHTLGLGHSPNQRDLMYYRDSDQQGSTRRTFLTFGDAMALWSTLNNRQINWVPDRPTITPASKELAPVASSGPRGPASVTVTDTDGTVIDVYPR